MSPLVHLPEEIKKEFSIDKQGKAYASRRATARLCGLNSNSSIPNLLKKLSDPKNLPEPLQPFAGQSFEGDPKIPDILVAAIITHYAFQGRKEAQKTLLAFTAIGIRTWLQSELDWESPEKFQKPQISPTEAMDICYQSLKGARIADHIAENQKLEVFAQLFPEYRTIVDSTKAAIASANPLQDKLLTPTELGELIAEKSGHSTRTAAAKVNALLCTHGLQEKVERISKKSGKTKYNFVLTQRGREFDILSSA